MDKKPFDRFNDKPPRRDRFESRDDRFGRRAGRFDDQGSRFGDRFSDRRARFGDKEGRFGERKARFEGNSERFSSRSERFGRFEERDQGFEKKPRFNKPPRRDFGRQSGPRARAFERRRFTDHAAFVKTATVRLDADVAEFFKSAEAVNAALRTVIELAHLVAPKAADESVSEVLTQEEVRTASSEPERADEDAVAVEASETEQQ